MAEGPMTLYRQRVADGDIRPDSAQRAAVEKLQLLFMRLKNYDPAAGRKVSLGWLGFGRKAAKRDQVLTGLYLYGGVGRGKSMLMDLFFDTAPLKRKRRVHFHAFMQEVHVGIHIARESGVQDPIGPVADEVAEGATLLCFDEVQVSDITDAMILGRLFEAMFARGVVVVATSNRHPDDLYKDGLNREHFLPFIRMLKERVDIHELAAAADYRQDREAGERVYFSPLDSAADRAMDQAWKEETAGEDERALTLSVRGRRVEIPRTAGEAGRAGFAELCGTALGPADYLAVAEAFETFFLDRVPVLDRSRNNEAKRFVTLIDALYEAKVRLFISAAAEPEALYVEGEGSFEFARTASRLAEMSSADWTGARAEAAAS